MRSLLILFLLYSFTNSYGQLFIDDGSGASLYIKNASGGTLASHESVSENVALFVDGDITIEGTLENTVAEIQVSGNFANSGTFTSTGDEVFNGGATQTISGTLTGSNDFYNLIINKSTGTIVQLGTNIEVDGAGILNLNQGLISTTSSHYVHVKNTAVAAITNAGSNGALDKFVEGELRRSIIAGNTYSFPVGGTHIDAGGGDGIQTTSFISNAGNGVASVVFHDSTGVGMLDSIVICPTGTGDFQDIEYRIENGSWEVSNPGGGITDFDLTLHPTDYTDNGYVDYTILVDGSPTGRDLCDGSATSVPITHDSLSLYGFYEVGASTLTSLLPIQLTYFEINQIKNHQVKLTWQTASEINNDYFTIEKSKDGLNWEDLINVDGAGNSASVLDYSAIDSKPFYGSSYYRLKQTDFNGEFEYSLIRSINLSDLILSYLKIYPNPVKDHLIIAGDETELNHLKIYTAIGQDVRDQIRFISKNDSKLIIDLSVLNSGMYLIKTITTANKVYKQ